MIQPFYALLRALSTLRGLRGAPEVPPLCLETQSLGQQMLKHVNQLKHVTLVPVAITTFQGTFSDLFITLYYIRLPTTESFYFDFFLCTHFKHVRLYLRKISLCTRMNLRFLKPMLVEKGQRFTIRAYNKTIGTGVFTDVLKPLTPEEHEDITLNQRKRDKREAKKAENASK